MLKNPFIYIHILKQRAEKSCSIEERVGYVLGHCVGGVDKNFDVCDATYPKVRKGSKMTVMPHILRSEKGQRS